MQSSQNNSSNNSAEPTDIKVHRGDQASPDKQELHNRSKALLDSFLQEAKEEAQRAPLDKGPQQKDIFDKEAKQKSPPTLD